MTGGRINRFNIVKQSKDYDQYGEYIKLWIPELKDVPIQYIHEPWKMTAFQQMEYHVQLGKDYPYPLLSLYDSNNHDGTSSGSGDGTKSQSSQQQQQQQQQQRGKERKQNTNNKNRGQKYEMKSVKTGEYNIK
jgi:deoxyribodipyrimidine photo-lyase